MIGAGAELDYFLNANVKISLQYLYQTRLSTLSGFNYDRHEAGLALKLQY